MKYILSIIGLGLLLTVIHQARQNFTTLDPQPFETSLVADRGTHTMGQELVEYAKLFYGVPYRYGSSDPEKGFDCSGFISHVYTHFGIEVPRSSVNFTDVGTPVEVDSAAPGDLVLFTGTDPESGTVGHIGIVVKNDRDGLEFIHSTSGKQYSVTVTPLEGYYETRFVKVIRVI
ncbi:C40 family peptidase [Salmonirosea aquatica]|uniref:Peptidoglycan endopeptidase n=1 Tax=Salmonirosea aquatica TaxID=2654236 RepID=A0A7C9BHB8_9BACT|nr:peptidoglycan endopeptidase [Cytophagaceae bacterium SJW1-29]